MRNKWLAALLVLSCSIPAISHAATVGYTPSGDAPAVPLPPIADNSQNTSQPAASPAPVMPSTSLTRNGGQETYRDMSKAPTTEPTRPVTSSATSANTASNENPLIAHPKGSVLVGNGRAFDGHSLTVGGVAVRLDGIEAPSLSQTCMTSSGSSWACGQRAYEELSSLVNNKKVACVVKDKAGAGLAAVCTASRIEDLGRFLVSEGLAVPNVFSHGSYDREARFAKAARAGLWVGTFQDPAKWRLSHP